MLASWRDHQSAARRWKIVRKDHSGSTRAWLELLTRPFTAALLQARGILGARVHVLSHSAGFVRCVSRQPGWVLLLRLSAIHDNSCHAHEATLGQLRPQDLDTRNVRCVGGSGRGRHFKSDGLAYVRKVLSHYTLYTIPRT